MMASSGLSVLGSLHMEKVFFHASIHCPVSILFNVNVSGLYLEKSLV